MSAEAIPSIDVADAPMATDRGAGWAYIRDAGPVVVSAGRFHITRRADVEWALRHPELFSSQKAFELVPTPLPLVPIAFDPPEHTQYRKILQQFFSRRPLEALKPALQTQITDLVKQIATQPEVEVISELAVPYPSQVFLTLFGLPIADTPRLVRWKDAVLDLTSVTEVVGEPDLSPALELLVYLGEHIDRKRTSPEDDVLSSLLTAEEPLTDVEAIGLAFLFVLAGLDTVTSTTGFALNRLANEPELRRRIVAEPSLIPAFVEEIVRLEAPLFGVPRVTVEEVEVSGITIPKGAEVMICLGAANREVSESNPHPDEVNLDGNGRHWGYGGGAHICVGMHLARIELELILRTWHEHIPDYCVRDGFTPRIPWPASTFCFESLPLVLGSA